MLETVNALPNILIVDDDSSVVLILNKVLNKIGRIRFASDGKQALTMVKQSLPDLILLDVQLPDITGLEVCSLLKNDTVTESIPVLFITSNMDEGFEEKVFNVGAADYISKPLNPRVVAARVRTHLDYHRVIKAMEVLAHTDSMTGLANRRVFDEHLNEELRRCRREGSPLTVVLLDIDEFKKYNDYFGHIEGDECIKDIALAIEDNSRRPGDLAARYGGEEFAYVLPNTGVEGAMEFLEKVRNDIEALNLKHAPDAQYDVVTISVGYSTIIAKQKHTDDGCNALPISDDDIIKVADHALYESKTRGRNCISYAALDS